MALALGSGGARGYAHIGVIEVLEERGFEIVSIAGSSMGALVGGLHTARVDHQHGDVVAAIQSAVDERPLRERRWALLALALYRSFGFVDLPAQPTPYARCDVWMELRL